MVLVGRTPLICYKILIHPIQGDRMVPVSFVNQCKSECHWFPYSEPFLLILQVFFLLFENSNIAHTYLNEQLITITFFSART